MEILSIWVSCSGDVNSQVLLYGLVLTYSMVLLTVKSRRKEVELIFIYGHFSCKCCENVTEKC